MEESLNSKLEPPYCVESKSWNLLESVRLRAYNLLIFVKILTMSLVYSLRCLVTTARAGFTARKHLLCCPISDKIKLI